jgi:hypothetical protein
MRYNVINLIYKKDGGGSLDSLLIFTVDVDHPHSPAFGH